MVLISRQDTKFQDFSNQDKKLAPNKISRQDKKLYSAENFQDKASSILQDKISYLDKTRVVRTAIPTRVSISTIVIL